MSFVNDHVYPFISRKERSILDDVLVCRQQDLPRFAAHLVLHVFSNNWGAFVAHNDYAGSPFCKFHLPIAKRAKGDNAEERPVLLLFFHEVGDQ